MTHESGMTGKPPAPCRSSFAETAQSLVEFAMFFPFMLLLCLGVVEIGRAAFISMTVGNAAFAGAQYGSQNSTTATDSSGISAAALNDASFTGMSAASTHYCQCDPVSGTGAGTSCKTGGGGGSCSGISCGSGQVVECIRVTTHTSFNPIFHYPGLPGSFQANGNAVMRVRK
jgi:hypothetical protein